MKKFIEMRGADGGPWRRICALPALWVGLVYDQTALDAAWDLTKDWTAEEREQLRIDASVKGLKAEIRGQSMLDIARETLAISEAGLKARACPGADGLLPDETHFLNALKEVVDNQETPAEELLRRFDSEWDHDFAMLYKDCSY